MKKFLVILFTLALLVSCFSATVYAEGEDVNSEDVISAEDKLDKAEEKDDEDMNVDIDFSTERMPTALKHMGIGLAGVMMVLALIGVVVFILNKIFKPKQ